ncbi:MAG: hypothetical protein ACYTHM_07395 [Planctomycetota bacterium]|jgi:hypothetical protein
MQPIESIFKAAFETLKMIDPQAEIPKGWMERRRELENAPPEKVARFALDILKTLNEIRQKSFERLARAEAGLLEIVENLASLLQDLPGAAAPPPPKPPETDAPQTLPEPDETEASEGEGGEDAEGPSPTLGALESLETLPGLAGDLPVDPADLAFIPKSLEMFKALGSGETGMEARILYNCIWQLEAILERYGGEEGIAALGGKFQRFEQGLMESMAALAQRLEALEFTLFPREAAGRFSDLLAAVGKDAAVPVPFFSSQERETVLGIRRSGVRSPAGLEEKAQVRISLGENEAAGIIGGAHRALMACKPRDPKDRVHLAKGIRELRKYLGNLHTQPDGYTFVRYAVNILHERDAGNRLKGALGTVSGFLEKGGFQEITVPLGDPFDDSFSPSKYERKRVPSDRPKNTILAVLQRGYLDPKGVPIQKAVVAVSEG